MRIEIAGGIAAGKTSLARLLGESDSRVTVVEEHFADNPFWTRLPQAPSFFAREKNASFLAQHVGDLKSASGPLVCDFAVFQDVAYASLERDDVHLTAMRALYEDLYARLPPPTLIVHLTCSAREQLARIRARGRPEESGLSIEYLQVLNRAIEEYRAIIRPTTRVLEISSRQIDVHRDAIGAISWTKDLLATVLDNPAAMVAPA
ncbi:MAG: deoxynucleoside kinase [Methylocella sp.]